MLNGRTCALFRADAKETTKGARPLAAPSLWWRPKAATFVLAPNKAHVLALSAAHVLRLKKADDVLALNKAHVLLLNAKMECYSFQIWEAKGVGVLLISSNELPILL